jgi:hypothetical protein
MPMLHYSLTTKKTRTSRREELGNLDQFKRLVHYGGTLPPPRQKYRLRVNHIEGGAVFTLMRARNALVTCGLAWNTQGERIVWNSLKNLVAYLGNSPDPGITPKGRPVPPERLPWTGSVVLPGWRNLADQDLSWVDSFQQAMAWLIWEARTQQDQR